MPTYQETQTAINTLLAAQVRGDITHRLEQQLNVLYSSSVPPQQHDHARRNMQELLSLMGKLDDLHSLLGKLSSLYSDLVKVEYEEGGVAYPYTADETDIKI